MRARLCPAAAVARRPTCQHDHNHCTACAPPATTPALDLLTPLPPALAALLPLQVRHYAAQFSPDLFDLTSRILHLDPRKRIRLEDIAAHPWMQK